MLKRVLWGIFTLWFGVFLSLFNLFSFFSESIIKIPSPNIAYAQTPPTPPQTPSPVTPTPAPSTTASTGSKDLSSLSATLEKALGQCDPTEGAGIIERAKSFFDIKSYLKPICLLLGAINLALIDLFVSLNGVFNDQDGPFLSRD